MCLANKAPNAPGTGTINAIKEEYGSEIARMVSVGLSQYWKTHDTSYTERRTYPGQIGLAGVNLDYSVGTLRNDAALSRRAIRYAFHELNGFPDWVEELAGNFPTEFCSEVQVALLADFRTEQTDNDHYTSDCISKVVYSGSSIRNLVAPMLLQMMMVLLPENRRDRTLCLDIVARSPEVAPNHLSRFLVSGYRAAFTRFDFREAWVWLDALMNSNSRAARSILTSTFGDLQGAQKALFVEYLGRGGDEPALEEGTGLVRREYVRDPVLLEWMVRASYMAWPPENDLKHEKEYSPGKEDCAASNRESYVDMLGAINSQDAVNAFERLAQSKDLLAYHNKFLREIELMKRRAGRRPELSPDETIQFLNDQSKTPATVDDFRKLCETHLKTLLEKLHFSDDDEGAFFRRGDAKENDLRNWLAARLRDVGERYYTVIKEQEVGGKKRPDLRIHSRDDALGKVSVEIKLADMDHWSGDQLVDALGEQLSKQYLLEPSSHTGVYVLVNASRPRKRELDEKTKTSKRKAFRKKVAGKQVNFEGLIQCVEAKSDEVNDKLADDKRVILVSRDISEEPSETI